MTGNNKTLSLEPGSLTKSINEYFEFISGDDYRQIYLSNKKDGKKHDPTAKIKLSFVLAILVDNVRLARMQEAS